MKLSQKCVGFVAFAVVSGCVNRGNNEGGLTKGLTVVPDPKFHEVIFEDEELWIQKAIAAATKTIVKAQRASDDGLMRRDAHPKAHGCVQGTFSVDANRPAASRVGVFEKEQSFLAWIRFSNAATVGKDRSLDARGIAIKLMNVPGKKLIAEEIDETTQDFLLVNDPVFPSRNIKQYVGLLENTALFLATHPREAALAFRAVNHSIETPLEHVYFSMSAYRFGERMAKYRVAPCEAEKYKSPDKKDDNFLRKAMVEQLSAGDACLKFSVQFFVDNNVTPIEDPSIEWKEKDSLFLNVATLRIPKQVFDTPEQNKFCENLSFTPWHALPEHRPLGNLNRARLAVYQAISKARHAANRAPRDEPKP